MALTSPVTPPGTADAAASAFARAAMYRLLAEALCYPTDDGVSLLRGACLADALRGARRLDGAVRHALPGLRRALRKIDRERAERAHVAAFGHSGSPRVVPYEGAYLTTNVFQESDALADIAGFHRAFGVEPAPSRSERSDHVALELEFMYLLAYKEGHARTHHGPEQVELCVEAQRAFLAAHLGRWGAAFFGALAAAPGGAHHAALARAGEAFLAAEAARAGAVAGGARPQRVEPELTPEIPEGWCPLPLEGAT